MDKVVESKLTPSAIDDFLSLPRLDRHAVYRTLSVSDRMRLDREVRRRKSNRKKKKSSTLDTLVASGVSGRLQSLSPRLQEHLSHVLEADSNLLGSKTDAYLRKQFDFEEALNA